MSSAAVHTAGVRPSHLQWICVSSTLMSLMIPIIKGQLCAPATLLCGETPKGCWGRAGVHTVGHLLRCCDGRRGLETWVIAR